VREVIFYLLVGGDQ